MAGHSWYVGQPRIRLVRSLAKKCNSHRGTKFPDDNYCFPWDYVCFFIFNFYFLFCTTVPKLVPKKLFSAADVSTAPGAHDIYEVPELIGALSKLIAAYIDVPRWVRAGRQQQQKSCFFFLQITC